MRLTELKCYDDDPLYRELNEMGLYCSDSFWIGICITFKYWCLNPLGEWRHASEVADAINKLHQEGKTDVFIDDKDSFSRGLNHIICISLSVLPIWGSMKEVAYYCNKYDIESLVTTLVELGFTELEDSLPF